MAVDREFDVYSLAVSVPWNLCNRAVGWRSGDEGDGRAGDRAAGQAATGQESLWSKKLQKPLLSTRFLRHPCDSYSVLKIKIRNFERGFKFEPK